MAADGPLAGASSQCCLDGLQAGSNLFELLDLVNKLIFRLQAQTGTVRSTAHGGYVRRYIAHTFVQVLRLHSYVLLTGTGA